MESDSVPPSEPFSLIIWMAIMLAINASYYHLLISLVLITLLAFSALISGSEVAFFSITPAQIQDLKESEDKADFRVRNLLERPRLLLATILISNNFVNVSIIILFNFLMNQLLPDSSIQVIAVINAAILTPILVFFGEVSPKVFANQNNLFLARMTARFFKFLRGVTYPLGWLLVKTGLIIERRFENLNHEIDLDEIEKAIDLSTTDGSTQEDVEILKGIVHFGNTNVKQIMTPRVDIIAVQNAYSFGEILELVRESGYSRLPVYEETIDKIEGVLYLKDLLEHLDKGDDYLWQELIREPFFVPEAKKIDDLLREIQANRKHQAIVVDEYGGTKGLVTLEDILEEVLGEIRDEFDESFEQSYKKINKNSFVFDAKITLIDMCEALGIEEDEFEEFMAENGTLAGLILELAGELPKKESVFTYKKYVFTVLTMEKNRVGRVKLITENA
uniref:Gliding motility protein n=1 Tax=uncultured Flavobacteriia bacterium TaxID=212695 RepID=H6RG82_9BACT|nr:gliding motility protein [uncultured Flavobacteriia bacterium]